MAATDLTEDVSLHDVELAPSEVANDAKLATSQELPNASGDPSLSSPDLAPSARSKRWLWAAGALALLLSAGYFVSALQSTRDLRKGEYALVGAPAAAPNRAPASANAVAATKTQAPVASEPERASPPAVTENALLPSLLPEGEAKALQAAQPSVGTASATPKEEAAEAAEPAGTTPNDEASEELEAAERPEVEAEQHDPPDAARLSALKRADGLVSQASALRKRRKLEPARSKFRAALAVYPGHPRALYGLVQVAIQQHDGRQAVQLARELVQAKPEQVSYLVLLGDAYKAAGKPKDAREAWKSAARQGSTVARKRLK